MAWIFRLWTLLFWMPAVASVAIGWSAMAHGVLMRPLLPALWFLTAFVLQFTSAPLSIPWTAGLVAQSALAIYLSFRLKLDA
jgi:hypothetical protein